MTLRTNRNMHEATHAAQGLARLASVLAMAVVASLVPRCGDAAGSKDDRDDGRHCSATARALFEACGSEAEANRATAGAICINEFDKAERAACVAEARASRGEGDRLCRAQLKARRDACKLLGEERYDPDFDPALFDDDFGAPTNPNPYFPLQIGNQWEFRGGSESVTVEVLNQTKKIEGLTCIVVRDRVLNDGELIEDTNDWFAQAKDGNTWYCGEEVKSFETFAGDKPMAPELVTIDGSFKEGRDGDKAGIISLASPQEGDVYLEEFSLGNAEDFAEVRSTTYSFGSDPTLDELVPRPLAELLCSGDCVVTENHSLLEPGIFERKYYATGIGVFLEVTPVTGEVLQLVGCNLDPRCSALPVP